MKAKGLRQVTVWAIDTRTSEFAAEAKRQSELVAESDRETREWAWLESIQADWGPYDAEFRVEED